MASLPLIVGMGGMNAAGRTSGFHAYKRLVWEALSSQNMHSTWMDLAYRMGHDVTKGMTPELIQQLQAGTLIRRIETFDPDHVERHIKAQMTQSAPFLMRKSKLPRPCPSHWVIKDHDEYTVEVSMGTQHDILIPIQVSLGVSSAGGIPSGFNPGALYNSHHHPRGLSLTIYGVSDALKSLGIEWSTVMDHVHPDEVSVYAGSALSQVDEHSLVGLIAEPLKGNRVNSKMMPLALAEMPADFINSYVLNSVGQTGTQVAACATFLYNLKQGMMDIQSGRAKVAVIGNAEAPIVPEIIDGFNAMGALATDESLQKLDDVVHYNERRTCRPFSSNTGFTLAEGAQFVILMQEELALELGAPIYGSVADVFIHADGNKKSISKPGVGNYLTFAKATALARAILGDENLAKTYVQAHGTGTPQNRTTESHLINSVAKTFGIKKWPVAAVKSYLGHSLGVAAGDQLMASLGVWRFGYIPGIRSIDHIAHDVHRSHLKILMDHEYVGEHGQDMLATLINSKGFGGNNATGLILSPHYTQSLIKGRLTREQWQAYQEKNQQVLQTIEHNDQRVCHGEDSVIYHFGTDVMDEADVVLSKHEVKLSKFKHSISLPSVNPYATR